MKLDKKFTLLACAFVVGVRGKAAAAGGSGDSSGQQLRAPSHQRRLGTHEPQCLVGTTKDCEYMGCEEQCLCEDKLNTLELEFDQCEFNSTYLADKYLIVDTGCSKHAFGPNPKTGDVFHIYCTENDGSHDVGEHMDSKSYFCFEKSETADCNADNHVDIIHTSCSAVMEAGKPAPEDKESDRCSSGEKGYPSDMFKCRSFKELKDDGTLVEKKWGPVVDPGCVKVEDMDAPEGTHAPGTTCGARRRLKKAKEPKGPVKSLKFKNTATSDLKVVIEPSYFNEDVPAGEVIEIGDGENELEETITIVVIDTDGTTTTSLDTTCGEGTEIVLGDEVLPGLLAIWGWNNGQQVYLGSDMMDVDVTYTIKNTGNVKNKVKEVKIGSKVEVMNPEKELKPKEFFELTKNLTKVDLGNSKGERVPGAMVEPDQLECPPNPDRTEFDGYGEVLPGSSNEVGSPDNGGYEYDIEHITTQGYHHHNTSFSKVYCNDETKLAECYCEICVTDESFATGTAGQAYFTCTTTKTRTEIITVNGAKMACDYEWKHVIYKTKYVNPEYTIYENNETTMHGFIRPVDYTNEQEAFAAECDCDLDDTSTRKLDGTPYVRQMRRRALA